jgi:hypothetical protein
MKLPSSTIEETETTDGKTKNRENVNEQIHDKVLGKNRSQTENTTSALRHPRMVTPPLMCCTACPALGWVDLWSSRCCTKEPATGACHGGQIALVCDLRVKMVGVPHPAAAAPIVLHLHTEVLEHVRCGRLLRRLSLDRHMGTPFYQALQS